MSQLDSSVSLGPCRHYSGLHLLMWAMHVCFLSFPTVLNVILKRNSNENWWRFVTLKNDRFCVAVSPVQSLWHVLDLNSRNICKPHNFAQLFEFLPWRNKLFDYDCLCLLPILKQAFANLSDHIKKAFGCFLEFTICVWSVSVSYSDRFLLIFQKFYKVRVKSEILVGPVFSFRREIVHYISMLTKWPARYVILVCSGKV